uniref:LD26231p n=1 Tax=Drosophila melanogaster TaxID=7227 RepID=Q95T17_DROME
MAKDCNWKVAPNWGKCMWQPAGVPDSTTGISGWYDGRMAGWQDCTMARWQDSRSTATHLLAFLCVHFFEHFLNISDSARRGFLIKFENREVSGMSLKLSS